MLSPGYDGDHKKRELLPDERALIEVLGWSEEDLAWFEEQRSTYRDIKPGEPTAFFAFLGLGPIFWQLVIGVALSYAAALLTPAQNNQGEPARVESRTEGGQNIIKSNRFTPTAGFDSQQNVVELGSIVPVIFANRETIGGVTYGGVRVNTNLLWSQLYSLGGSQLIKAMFMVGLGPIGAIDPKQFAIGDNLLGSYDLSTASNTNGRLSFYFRPGGGRITSGDLIAGRAANRDIANSENAGAGDVFQIRGVNGVYRPDFCYASKPSTQTTFGLYSPIGNDLAFRINPVIRSISVPQLKAVGKEGNAIVFCNDDPQLKAEREKQDIHFSTRSGIHKFNGSFTTDGTVYLAVAGNTIGYLLSSLSDAGLTFTQSGANPNGPAGPDGVATCEDVAQAVSGLQRTWDDALVVGERYRIGSCVAILEERLPPSQVFTSEADNTPFGGGQNIEAVFRVIRAGRFRASSSTQLNQDGATKTEHRNGTNGSHIHRMAVATAILDRPAQVIEIGFRSTLSLQITGLCDFLAARSYGDADYNACQRSEGDKIYKGEVLTTTQLQSDTFTGAEMRYSFWRFGYRIAGSDAAFTTSPQLFGFRSMTGQPSFNYLRVQFPSTQRWEYELTPVSGWEIRNDIDGITGQLEVLDSKISTVRTVFGADCAFEFNGVRVSRDPSIFRLGITESLKSNLGPLEKDGNSYADAWGKLAEQFIFSEIQASTDSPEHEVSYVNIITGNATTPLYNNLAKLGATIRSGTEMQSFQQLSTYVNQGFESTHLIGDVLRLFLTNPVFGLGEIVSGQQVEVASFNAANTRTYNRRHFFDAGVSEPFNYRQQGAQWAEYFLHDLLIRGGKFYLQPIALFDEPHEVGGMYTAGNVSEFEYTTIDPDQRIPPRVSVKWREEKQSGDLAGRGLFPVIREVLVREAGTPDNAPLQTIDLSLFCTNEGHAIDVAKMACRKQRLITSQVRIVTRPDRAAFDPGKIVKIGMEITKFNSPRNGIILADGTIVCTLTTGETAPLADGAYQAMVWNGSGAAINTETINVTGGVAAVQRSALFSLAGDTELSSQTFKVQKVDFTEDGDVEMEATEFPLDANGFSLLTAGWDVPENWVIEGAISAFNPTVPIVVSFVSVTILGEAARPAGSSGTYAATISGPAGVYTYAWTCSGATVASPTASSTSITFPTAGTYTVNVSVTLTGGPPRTDSLIVTVGTVATAPTIGTVTITGSTLPVIGLPRTYSATRSGTASDMTWLWSVLGDSVVAPTGASAVITFDTLGVEEVRVRGNSLTASDRSVIDTRAVTVIAQTIGTVTIAGPTTGAPLTNYSYTVSRSGNSVGTAWGWACPGATLTGTGAARTINFPTAGSYTITVTATAVNASDSPVVDTHAVVIT